MSEKYEWFYTYQITCSCGEVAIIKYNSGDLAYICSCPAWKYKPVNKGWYCGKEGHYQLKTVPYRENQSLGIEIHYRDEKVDSTT